MMRKNIVILFFAIALLPCCKKTEEKVEKPFYPAVGAINARYSVGDTTTVVFAQGNLQYQASTGTWRFASSQYDIIGQDNELVDTTYTGWIDLFGWGTSGFDSLMPYTIFDSSALYGVPNQDISGTDYDWGRFNAISNGGDKPRVWRTMSFEEWRYLLSFREQAAMKRGLATIRNVGHGGSDMCGLLLLPDKWEQPQGCAFRYGVANGYATNVYSAEEWIKMEGAGAVFLPAAGYRDKRRVALVGEYGCYWTGSYHEEETAYEIYMQSIGYSLSTAARSNGHSVRLVQER